MSSVAGTVTESNGDLLLVEGNSFTVGVERWLTIPQGAGNLKFMFDALSFEHPLPDTDALINDAFEVALVDAQG